MIKFNLRSNVKLRWLNSNDENLYLFFRLQNYKIYCFYLDCKLTQWSNKIKNVGKWNVKKGRHLLSEHQYHQIRLNHLRQTDSWIQNVKVKRKIRKVFTYVCPWGKPINYFSFQFITAIFSFVWCPAGLARFACIIFHKFKFFATFNTRPTALILMIVNMSNWAWFWTNRFWMITITFPA